MERKAKGENTIIIIKKINIKQNNLTLLIWSVSCQLLCEKLKKSNNI